MYDTFQLPAGLYEALRVTIGEGAGHNWWCVVFPTLCVPASSEGFQETAEASVSPASWPEPSLGRKGNTKFVFSSWIGWGRSKIGFIRDFRLPKAVCSQDAFPGNQTLQGICTNTEMR